MAQFEKAERFTDEEYLATLESITAYFLIKYHDGILYLPQNEWEKVVGPLVGGSLNISFDDRILTVTVSGSKDAKA